MNKSSKIDGVGRNLSGILTEFRRHYHRARSIHSELPDQGRIEFRLHGEAESGTGAVETRIPDEELAIRFALAMRRFLTPSSNLYVPMVWKRLVDEYGEHVPEPERKAFNDGCRQLENSPIKLLVNNQNLSAKDIYELMSEGHVFGNDEKAAGLLRSYFRMPIVGQLFRFQFIAYSTNGLQIASWIFDKIRQLHDIGVISFAGAVESPQCIYCRATDGPFKSEEHILPEALGWHDAILSTGIVCDKCNNGLLSQLDSSFVQFEPISFLRVMFVPLTKSGKYPWANFQNLTVSKKGPRHIEFVAKDGSADIRNRKDLGDGWQSWSQPFRGKILDPISLGRSLYKIGLGFVALEQGHKHALLSRFDAARAFIRGESLFNNRLLLISTVNPHPGFRAEYMDLSPGTGFALDVFGVIFLFNLEPYPVIEPPPAFKEVGFLELDLSHAD